MHKSDAVRRRLQRKIKEKEEKKLKEDENEDEAAPLSVSHRLVGRGQPATEKSSMSPEQKK